MQTGALWSNDRSLRWKGLSCKKRYDTLSEESKGIILSNTNLLWLIFLLLNNTERKKKVVKGKLAEEQKLGVRNLRKFSNTKT